jgi:hypothetical protein
MFHHFHAHIGLPLFFLVVAVAILVAALRGPGDRRDP